MRIIKIIIVLGIVLILNACSGSFEGKVEKVYPDGSPKLISYYAKDEPGILVRQKMYYANKQLRIDGFFKAGEKDGKWVYYFENGKMWSQGNYKNGMLDGDNKTFHTNGELSIKGSYRKGVRIGVWYFYDESGVLEKEVNYDEK